VLPTAATDKVERLSSNDGVLYQKL
jgi:hypothetical protein